MDKTMEISGRQVVYKPTKIRTSTGEKIFTVLNYTFFILFAIATVFPFINLIAKSLSGEAAVISGSVSLWPVDFQTGTYKYVLANPQFMNSFKITIFITVVGTSLSLFMTALAAYPLSKPYLKGRRVFMIIFIFTMLFSGGLIPNFLLIQKLGLYNKVWALILPGMVSVYNMLIIKSSFEAIPDSLEESAKLDGASNFTIFMKIIIPLSKPVLATIALFFAVGFWNSYFSAMLYITNPALKPLQLYLKELLAATADVLSKSGGPIDVDKAMNVTPEAVQAASIVTATVPIICVYPFLQGYFVKGVMIGSVKG
jgi:putative aldouronate transport system permease protein